MQAIAEMTGGRETILPGTLYAALARMVDEGLIEEREGPAEGASGGPKRRYYKSTKRGLTAARAESERLRALLDIARKQKILQGVRR
jgi:DNA-binding PadR family transcriptional regulator